MAPSVAAMLYAGAVDATPMTTLEMSPRAPDLRPFSAWSSVVLIGVAAGAGSFIKMAMVSRLQQLSDAC
jgi:hypothetical protein